MERSGGVAAIVPIPDRSMGVWRWGGGGYFGRVTKDKCFCFTQGVGAQTLYLRREPGEDPPQTQQFFLFAFPRRGSQTPNVIMDP